MLNPANHLGMITTPKQGNKHVPGVKWVADNGCFGKGYPGDQQWFAWLESLTEYANDCLFAVAPDVFNSELGKGDAVATLERSAPWLLLGRVTTWSLAERYAYVQEVKAAEGAKTDWTWKPV